MFNFRPLAQRQSYGGTPNGFPKHRQVELPFLPDCLTTEKPEMIKKIFFPQVPLHSGSLSRGTQAGREFRPGPRRGEAELAGAVNLWQTVCNIPDTENKPGGATAWKIQTQQGPGHGGGGERENMSRGKPRGQESLTPDSEYKVFYSPSHSLDHVSSRSTMAIPSHKSSKFLF